MATNPAGPAQLAEILRRNGRLASAAVEDAFRSVPREHFLPDTDPERVYRDEAIPIKTGTDGQPSSSSSQPSIMATMLEQLDLKPGLRVLEIGAGTGYNAALIKHIVGDAGTVVTVDLDQDLVTAAEDHLRLAGYPDVKVRRGDGAEGWSAEAPYDRMIVTAGATDLPPAWLAQLIIGGRLVLPLSLRGPQRSVAFTLVDGGRLESESVYTCGFMPLRGGAFPDGKPPVTVGPDAELTIWAGDETAIDADALQHSLLAPGPRMIGDTSINITDFHDGLVLRLTLNEPLFARVGISSTADEQPHLPGVLFTRFGASTYGLVSGDSMACLDRASEAADEDPIPVAVKAYGPEGLALAERLIDHVEQWDEAGRPASKDLRITADQPGATPEPDAYVIDLPHARLSVRWRRPADS